MRSNTPYEYLNSAGSIEEVYSPSNPQSVTMPITFTKVATNVRLFDGIESQNGSIEWLMSGYNYVGVGKHDGGIVWCTTYTGSDDVNDWVGLKIPQLNGVDQSSNSFDTYFDVYRVTIRQL